jgi:hypothetical protein
MALEILEDSVANFTSVSIRCIESGSCIRSDVGRHPRSMRERMLNVDRSLVNIASGASEWSAHSRI